MLRKIVLMIVFSLSLFGEKVEFLDTKILKSHYVKGLKFTEISDIAYDKKSDLFYALSDRGRIFKLKIDIKDKKIAKIRYLDAKKLTNRHNKPLSKKKRDSEGMAIVGDEIWISFEGRDRILVYDKDFRYKREVKLPKVLKNMVKRDYSGTGFEALTYSKKYGFITAREVPFDEEPKGCHTIFSKDGVICRFKRDKYKSSLTEFEMMDDGNLLALFRKFSLKKLKFHISLKKIYIASAINGTCKTKELFHLDLFNDGYVDNYEGLTHYKGNMYMMISDDNNNIFQKTYLRLFEIKDDK